MAPIICCVSQEVVTSPSAVLATKAGIWGKPIIRVLLWNLTVELSSPHQQSTVNMSYSGVNSDRNYDLRLFTRALTHFTTIVFLQQLTNDGISERDFSVSETKILKFISVRILSVMSDTLINFVGRGCPRGRCCGHHYCCDDLLDWFQNSW